MSYFEQIEYKVIPTQSFSVIRNCSGCGKKMWCKNTERFRVNANGNRLDVWLIYQCEKCKHTLNLAIYERKRAGAIPKEEYRRFLNNDTKLAREWGSNFLFFKQNKAEVDFENIKYELLELCRMKEDSDCEDKILITIDNPNGLPIRPEKLIAEIVGVSRSHVKKLVKQEEIVIESKSSEAIKAYVGRELFEAKEMVKEIE